jgi:hypothetical protein
LLNESSLKYVNKAGAYVEVVVFLFNDLIMICKRKKKSEGGYLLYKAPIPLEKCIIIDKEDSSSKKTLN